METEGIWQDICILPIENVFVPITVMAVLAVICIGVSLRFFKW